jgi:hypothetical protein
MNYEENKLEELAQLKWGDMYSCARCGHDAYKKGKDPFDRRCKKCDYQESLTKFTALEGLKISAAKAAEILEQISKNGYIDWNAKVIAMKRFRTTAESHLSIAEEKYYGDGLLSIEELLKMYKDKEISGKRLEALVTKHHDEMAIKPAELSRTFGVESNTVKKLVEKVDRRFMQIGESENLQGFVKDYYDGFPYIISMVMLRLDDTFRDGCVTVGNMIYKLCKPSVVFERWEFRIVPQADRVN